MGAAVVLGVVFLFLVVILAGLLRGLDWDDLRARPHGLLSLPGVRAIVGGGFLVGFGYGLLVGGQSGAESWRWLSRGVVDGLVVACAGAFYLGYQQRKLLRGRSTREAAGDAGGMREAAGGGGGTVEPPEVAGSARAERSETAVAQVGTAPPERASAGGDPPA